MSDNEYVVEFATAFGRGIVANGGTLERANDKMNLICESYGLKDISIFSLSSIIILSAKDEQGNNYTSQVKITPCGIHVEKLNRYNALAYQVCTQTPEPSTLMTSFEKAGVILFDYDKKSTLYGFVLALGCICWMFNGTLKDIFCVGVSTCVMFVLINGLNSPGINQILKNIICMFVAGCLGIFYVKTGIGDNLSTILLTNAFMIIPGIPMVNAIRNLLRGNEMNGIIEFIKVILETFAILIGIVLSIMLFGGNL